MKSGQIFWGTFFLALGSLIFLVRYDVLDIYWGFAWDLWPLIFIFWGLIVIAKNSKVKPFITAFFGLFLAITIFGVVRNFSVEEIYIDDDDSFDVSRYSQDFDSTSNYANLEVNGGVGTFIIKRTTNNLIDGIAKGPVADYNFETRINDSTVWIDCSLENAKIIFPSHIKNKLELKLNDQPLWNLEFNIGAAKASLDLSKFKISNLSLNSGATSTKIKLGSKYNYTNVNVDMGAASLEIDLPKESGCKITGEMVLVLKDLQGFKKLESGDYITENYDKAENKIAIDMNSGVSSITVNRY